MATLSPETILKFNDIIAIRGQKLQQPQGLLSLMLLLIRIKPINNPPVSPPTSASWRRSTGGFFLVFFPGMCSVFSLCFLYLSHFSISLASTLRNIYKIVFVASKAKSLYWQFSWPKKTRLRFEHVLSLHTCVNVRWTNLYHINHENSKWFCFKHLIH